MQSTTETPTTPSPEQAPQAHWLVAVERTVNGFGFDLVDTERVAGGLLRVTIDRIPGQAYDTPGEAVTVEDCERVTRQLQYVLEVEGMDYERLEVSSPGLDRPLKKLADWQRFVGWHVQVTLRVAFQGRKHWRGLLAEREGGWRLELPPEMPKRKPGAKVGKAALAKAQAAAQEQQQALDFTLDEVREARLVPVVNFKGRQAQPDGAAADATPDDGGSIQ